MIPISPGLSRDTWEGLTEGPYLLHAEVAGAAIGVAVDPNSPLQPLVVRTTKFLSLSSCFPNFSSFLLLPVPVSPHHGGTSFSTLFHQAV